jgi:hypothetical protein
MRTAPKMNLNINHLFIISWSSAVGPAAPALHPWYMLPIPAVSLLGAMITFLTVLLVSSHALVPARLELMASTKFVDSTSK